LSGIVVGYMIVLNEYFSLKIFTNYIALNCTIWVIICTIAAIKATTNVHIPYIQQENELRFQVIVQRGVLIRRQLDDVV